MVTFNVFNSNFFGIFSEKCSEIEFKEKLERLLGRLKALEMRKMGPPNYSKSIKSLVKFLGISLDED